MTRNPMPELAPQLKQLRLSGILDSLADRNRQAIDKKMSYVDFLAMLITDEVARRDHKKYTTRVRRAGFRVGKTIESFDFDHNPTINRELVTDLVTCRYIDERAPLLIAGPTGTGKSHIAQALGHAAVQEGHDVAFVTHSKLLGHLHEARAVNAYQRRFATYAKVDLLIIDDFGLKPMQSPHDEDFHDLITERYETHSTIVTSNLEFAEWQDAFPNRILGAATLDRLRHDAYRLVLDGDSYRTPRPLPTSNKKTKQTR